MSVHYSPNEGWRIRTPGYGPGAEFAFDLPKELLRVFDRDGRLKRSEALDMKEDHLEEIHAYRLVDHRVETMVLKLDQSWLESAREAFATEEDEPDVAMRAELSDQDVEVETLLAATLPPPAPSTSSGSPDARRCGTPATATRPTDSRERRSTRRRRCCRA